MPSNKMARCTKSSYIPKYESVNQYVEYDTTLEIHKDAQKYTQQITGKFLWMAPVVDENFPTTLSTIAS